MARFNLWYKKYCKTFVLYCTPEAGFVADESWVDGLGVSVVSWEGAVPRSEAKAKYNSKKYSYLIFWTYSPLTVSISFVNMGRNIIKNIRQS